MTILEKIIEAKKEEIEKLKQNEYGLKLEVFDDKRKVVSFKESLMKSHLSVIAEIKKASPSAGIISEDFDYFELARNYIEAEADAFSILTEQSFFLGDPSHLSGIRKTYPQVPILRKDFIIDEVQIYESFLLGADAILLIVSLLDRGKLEDFYFLAKQLQLDVLIEVHTQEELELVLGLEIDIIGINNRDLKNFSVDLHTFARLRKFIPSDKVVVAESGIKSLEDIKFLAHYSCDAILIGETFISQKGKIKNFIEEAHSFKNG